MLLIFIRHGEPKVLNDNFFKAHLSEEGLRQVKVLALSDELPKPDVIYSSPYNRAIETAKALCEVFKVEFEVKEFLKEWNLQSLNLLDPEFNKETQTGWNDPEKRVQGGESLEDLKMRAYKGIIQVVSKVQADNIFFISHGTLIEMLCSKVGNREASQINVKNMKFVEYATIRYTDGSFTLTKDCLSS